MDIGKGYNERLFNSGIRKKYHLSRFIWLAQTIDRYKINADRVFEFGCFDAKTLNYLPSDIKYYEGHDANWEGGLDFGKKIWKDKPHVKLVESSFVKDLQKVSGKFDLIIAQETLEHIPDKDLSGYLMELERLLSGYCLVTIPNEIGPLFLIKFWTKGLMRKQRDKYHWREVFWAFLGRADKVQRIQTGHKGFSYLEFLKIIGEHFEIIEAKGIPFRWLPKTLNPTIGIVMRNRNLSEKLKLSATENV